jgi:signal peptidase I
VNTRRRASVAGLLGFLAPGLGHLYAGRPLVAISVLLLGYAAVTLGLAFVWVSPLGIFSIVLPLVVALSVLVAVVWHSAATATRASAEYRLRRYNRWYVYLLIWLAVAFIWHPAFMSLLKSYVIEGFRSTTVSMEPTILAGDYLFVSKLPFERRLPRRGGLVVFESVGGPYQVIKRVVGRPGDTLSMVSGVLRRNGEVVPEPYVQFKDSVAGNSAMVGPDTRWQVAHLVARDTAGYVATMRTWGALVVPPDSLFVLGDNRDNSYDSRFFGAVGVDRLRGRPMVAYFSLAASADSSFTPRWHRVGHRY